MVRIKVYKASQLAVVLAAVLLAIVTIAIVVSMAVSGDAAATAGNIMDILAAEEVTAAFSMFEEPSDPIMPSFDGGEPGENEHTDEIVQDIIVEIISEREASEPVTQPRVLIYHTHTHEAYSQTEDDPYEETEVFRTADQAHSVVRVGEALTELLGQYGFLVTHDTTDHEPPKLSTAYARSLATLEGYEEKFDLYIDLHRDAYNSSLAECAYFGGQEVAQLMVLIGNGGDYEVKPDYEANLSFARRLTDCINQKAPGVCREVMVKNGRYNQHVGTPSILIEVGHNENTLQQALSSMPVLADALKSVLVDGE